MSLASKPLTESMIFKDISKSVKDFRNNFKTFKEFKPDLRNEGFPQFFQNSTFETNVFKVFLRCNFRKQRFSKIARR